MCNKGVRVTEVLETTEAPENGHTGIEVPPPRKEARSVAQLKYIYTNASSMDKKQNKLEAIMQQKNNDIVAITETWQDDSHNWSVVVDSYKRFKRGRQERRGDGVNLYVRECFDSIELDDGDDRVECS